MSERAAKQIIYDYVEIIFLTVNSFSSRGVYLNILNYSKERILFEIRN